MKKSSSYLLIAILLINSLGLSGCATAYVTSGGGWGAANPEPEGVALAAAFDVVTLPVQILVLAPEAFGLTLKAIKDAIDPPLEDETSATQPNTMCLEQQTSTES
ncbi:hypothetical protein [Cerasicoccus arenae]|uniref:YceK/YidQ family lipoprotein n=1 Tax=Cerasicoccus arenae TaxID=424488 RepID=A0A8J3DFA2_9BACT|nr:hypothetical protein [Cerasicoccus arenae]MBK1857059.1 hypothetical protein [Cerasicoccus arenae]GHB92124.1 hypothetical protein GCM10007047_03930 [Cerasicoccus arenae]